MPSTPDSEIEGFENLPPVGFEPVNASKSILSIGAVFVLRSCQYLLQICVRAYSVSYKIRNYLVDNSNLYALLTHL